MKHLTDEQLYDLAEKTLEMEPYNDEEMEQMEHLKTCESCYAEFCTLQAVLDVTSESGFMRLADIYQEMHAKETVVSEVKKNVLAVLQVVRKKVEEKMTAVIEQIDNMQSAFQFAPPLSIAARGLEQGETSLCTVEDMEEEKTFISFAPSEHKLMIQIDTKNLQKKELAIFLLLENGDRLEVPVTIRKNLVKGVITDLPDMDFEIHIEEKA